MSAFDIFWWCSSIAYRESWDARLMKERKGNGALRKGIQIPEEVTTFNFARQLASIHGKPTRRHFKRIFGHVGDARIAVHNKALEGGGAGRVASGADLEMAIEVRSGSWVSLLMQAKRLYPGGTYREWKPSQITKLKRWALAKGNTAPAMLLYNPSIAPFNQRVNPIDMGGCCHRKVLRSTAILPGYTPPHPKAISPLTFTLACLRPRTQKNLTGKSPAAISVNKTALPLECIFCPAATDAGRESSIPTYESPPQWAQEALMSDAPIDLPLGSGESGPTGEDELGETPSAEDGSPPSAFSIVIPYSN